MQITIKEFKTKAEIMLGYPIIHQLYDKMSEETYANYIDEMTKGDNYHMIAAYHDKNLVAVAGYWILTRFFCDRYIQIGNMVVDKEHRSKKIGAKLLKYVENKGKEAGCKKYILDSYTENKKSHKLYFKEGFFVEGLHFMKDI